MSEATRRALRSLSRCALEQRIDALTQEAQDLRSLVQKLGHFLSETRGLLRDHQDTAAIGLVWWLGQKTGAW